MNHHHRRPADARGTEQHNRDLGTSRAAAARNYLAQHRVRAQQMRLMSRGEQGARGDNEEGFSLDRRVDREMGDLNTSPILEVPCSLLAPES